MSQTSTLPIYDELAKMKAIDNFQNIQASRTINQIRNKDVLETILALIIHHYTKTNQIGQLNQIFYSDANGKFKLPYSGQCIGRKGPVFDFDQLPVELQDIIKNYLIQSS